MSTVSFAGTTIWDDSSSGFGQVQTQVADPVRALDIRPLIRGNGMVANDVGLNPGSVFLTLQYRISSADYNTLLSTLYGLISTSGSLVVPPGQTYTNCVILGRNSIRANATRDPGSGGATKYQVQISIQFQRLAI